MKIIDDHTNEQKVLVLSAIPRSGVNPDLKVALNIGILAN
jgi:hypothetical protein